MQTKIINPPTQLTSKKDTEENSHHSTEHEC